MSLPPNQFNNAQGPPMMTPMMSTGQQPYNQQPMFPGKPPNQAIYPGMNHDANSNSPIPNQTSFSPNNMQNNFNQSASGSPAFNRPSPMLQSGMPPMKQVPMSMPGSGMFPPPSSISNSAISSAQIPSNLPSNAEKVNHNTPPLNAPNSLNQLNGPSVSNPPMLNAGFAPYNNQNNQPSSGVLPPISSSYLPPGAAMSGVSQANIPVSAQQIFQKPPGPPPSSQPNAFVSSPMTGSLRNSPLVTGPPTSAPYGQPKPVGINGAGGFSPTPVVSQPGLQSGPPKVMGQSLPPTGVNAMPQSQPPLGVPAGLSAQPLQAGPMTQPAARPPSGSTGPSINNQPSALNSHFPPQSAPPNSGHQFYPPSSQATPPPPPTQFNPGPPLGPNAFPSSQPPSQPPTSMYQGPGHMMPPSSMMPPGSQSFQSSAVQSGPNIGPHGHQQNALMSQPGPPSGPALGPQSLPTGHQTRPLGPPVGPPSLQSGPPSLQGPPSFQAGPPGPPLGPTGLQSGPPGVQMGPTGPQTRPPGHQMGLQSGPTGHLTGPSGMQSGPPGLASGPTSGFPSGPPGLQTGPSGIQPGPPSGPPGVQSGPSNMQNRYPQMPPGNYNNQGAPPNPGYQQQYKAQGITQQMGNLSVTNQGFDQLWGHQDVDLMQCKNVLPEYPEEPPEIRLGPQFADAPNCSPDIFRCTVNRIPETNSLLQKARLPLGIVIHPFKDLNHLPVIQCSTIVRCRACRTYINPFVYFVDSKRWKCNLCFRVNDLPQEFQYDPVSKSYGDPSRRPEVRSATIEFIAPGEYMLRPPQPAVYLFLFDVSHLARESGYLEVVCSQLRSSLGQLPGDGRTQVAFICYDASVHFYLMADGLTRPKEMTVMDLDDVFLPSPEALLVNLSEQRTLVEELLSSLPRRVSGPASPSCALGAALQAAYKLAAPTGGRITVFQTCLPNVGPGALQSREDPNARSAKDVAHLSPATDFYKRLALECSGAQVAVDLFLLNSQYADLATLSGMSKFSAGSVYHIPLFNASRLHLADRLRRMLGRYLTRKIGFEAVMRVRCTRGVSIHTFHGNFFVRSTDLLSLPNVSPDNAFAMQLAVDESLADLQQVCFQAALLYTSSKGERRIRVHTLALPVASNLTDVLHSADQDCIITLLTKMAVDRAVSSSLSEAKEALSNVAVDVLSAHRLASRASNTGLACPRNLRLLPTYILAALKSISFRTGTSTRLDDRVYHMCQLKSLATGSCVRAIHAGLYEVSRLSSEPDSEPAQLPLSAESIDSRCAYLLDTGDTYIIFVCHAVSPAFLQETFGITAFSQLQDEARTLPRLEDDTNQLLHLFIEKLNEERPYDADILVLRDNSPSRRLFYDCLINDRLESAFSYYEFLQHIKNQVK